MNLKVKIDHKNSLESSDLEFYLKEKQNLEEQVKVPRKKNECTFKDSINNNLRNFVGSETNVEELFLNLKYPP